MNQDLQHGLSFRSDVFRSHELGQTEVSHSATTGDNFWQRPAEGGFLDVGLYLKMLETFVHSGDIPDKDDMLRDGDKPWTRFDDPLLHYLVQLMSDPQIQLQVFSSKAAGEIFYATVGRFVVGCLHNMKFESKRHWTEQKRASKIPHWSLGQRQDNWEALIQELNEKHANDGFDGRFFMHLFSEEGWKEQQNWEKLSHDWQEAIFEQIRKQEEDRIHKSSRQLTKKLETAFQQVKQITQAVGASEIEAVRAWNMMDGATWSESEFERHLLEARLNQRYPVIDEIIKKMGRTADDFGNDRLTVAAGGESMIGHASGSDIEGITIDNDINALLPSEWAQCADDTLENLFIYKYVTKSLQVFRHKSNSDKPVRKLDFTPARRTGPMVICIDTSASMHGIPERIEQILLHDLERLASEQDRDCFLIDFSVSVRPVDLRIKQRNLRLKALGVAPSDLPIKESSIPFINGGTDVKNMMEQLFALLDGTKGEREYVNADVLWITDFDIPTNRKKLLERMTEYRQTGTRFYGLRITDDENKASLWEPYFDHIYNVKYRRIRRF